MQKILKLTSILLLFVCTASAQTVSVINPVDFSVCQTGTFQIQISNNSDLPLVDTEVTVALPAGVEYDSGTACQTANASSPVFCLGTLNSGVTETFTFQARAVCDALAAVDAGQLFCNSVIVQHTGGTTTANPDCYEIEKPLLVITEVSETVLTGVRGQILQRNITVLNTLDGPLSSFTLVDAYGAGMNISVNQGTVVTEEEGTIEVLFDGADFTQIGNGNNLFEQEDGAFVITEFIEITSCGIEPPLSSVSDITLSYGCFGEICVQEETLAYVLYAESDATPALRYETTVTAPDCLCGNAGFPQILKIVNDGNGEALDMIVKIGNFGMDSESFLLENAGTTQDPNADFFNLSSFEACENDVSIAGFAEIPIPALAAGDSLHILWDTYFCRFAECQQPVGGWSYEVDYFTPCPPPANLFVDMEEPRSALPDTEPLLDPTVSVIEADPNGVLNDGENVTYEYQLQNDNFSLTEGTFHLSVTVPCDLVLDENEDFAACGQVPTVAPAPTDSTVVYDLTYTLPLDCDFLLPLDLQFLCAESCTEVFCKDTIITSCAELAACIIPEPQSADLIFTAVFDTPTCPRECALIECTVESYPKDCPATSYCETIIPGYTDIDHEFFRLNAGQGDSNDDHLPDGAIDWDLANRLRAMTGDTLRSELRGRVRVDTPTTTFNYGHIELEMGSDGLFFSANNELFSKETGVVPVNVELRIYDASADIYYDCVEPTLLPEPFFGFGYDISVNSLVGNECALPANFRYAQGDSIILISDYKVQYNLQVQEGQLPPKIGLNLAPSVYLYDTPNPAEEDLFTCGCERDEIELSGYLFRIQEGSFGLRPCETPDYAGGYLFRFELAEPDFFPFEYRPLGVLENWEMTLPSVIDLEESRVTFLRYQDGTDILTNEIITPTTSGDTYNFALQNLQIPAVDEGFIFLFQHKFLNECDLTGNFALDVNAEINLSPSLCAPVNPVLLNSDSPALRTQLPALVIDTLLACDISFDNKNRWTLSVINESELNTMNTAQNVWLHPVSPTGGLVNFSLINVADGTEYPQSNGVFQVGNLTPEMLANVQLIADNQSCVTENLLLRYGWNCEPYLDPTAPVCNENILPLKGISPPGEIALEETAPAAALQLCAESDFFEVEIFNADLGAICQPELQLILPPGLSIVPGSTEIAYPTDGAFAPVGDPDVSNPGLALWQISTLIPAVAEDCLPGVTSTPLNGFLLRFRALTDCNFPSGSRLRYFVSGEQNCGDASNISTEQSEKIFVTGADAPYSVSFSAPGGNVAVGCADTETILVSFSATAASLPGDSIYIDLPSGLTYVPGSYENLSNAAASEPTVTSAGGGILLLNEIPVGENQVSFQFDVAGLSALTCAAKIINVQTISHADALCVSTNESCSVPVVTGDLAVQLNFDRPEFVLSDLQISTNANEVVSYNFILENAGVTTQEPTLLDFFAGGNLVHSHTVPETLGSTIVSGSFNLSDDLLCDLTVSVNPAATCFCSANGLEITAPISYNLDFSETICPGESLEIGIPARPGATYQWNAPLSTLDCATCPTTDFTFENTGANNANFNYTLTETRAEGCVFNYANFNITVPPAAMILSADTEICAGECANIILSPAAEYVWTCAAIPAPGAASQTVCPTETTTYCVAVTNAFGCTDDLEITVAVKPLPLADAGPDLTFCPEDLTQLQAQAVAGAAYLWQPLSAVNNPDVSNPLLTTEENTTLTLTVFADGCENTDEVEVAFAENPNVDISADAEIICESSVAQLTATGAETYAWLPDPALSCLDCPNPVADSDESGTYYVVGTNAAGCFALDSISITVTEGEIVVNLEPQTICDGESVDFFGQTLTVSDEYCEIFPLGNGCDSLVCLDLTVLEPVEIETEEMIICGSGTVDFEGDMYTESGEYCVTLQNQFGCDSVRCLNLTVVPDGPLNITVDTTILIGESVQLNTTAGFDTYLWSPATGLSCTDCPDPIAAPDSTTVYTVTATDVNGCERSAETTVRVVTDCLVDEIEIPNVFTPNDDGVNDTFGVPSDSKLLEVLRFEVYSRWGELLFSGSGDVETVWDGNYKGKPSPAEVYVYLIEVKCLGEEEARFFKGNVSLLR